MENLNANQIAFYNQYLKSYIESGIEITLEEIDEIDNISDELLSFDEYEELMMEIGWA